MIPLPTLSDISSVSETDHSPFVDSLKCIRWMFTTNQNIHYLFNSCETSEQFPFTYCRVADKEYTKLLNGIVINNAWIEHINGFNDKNDDPEISAASKRIEKYTSYIIAYYEHKEVQQRIFITPLFIEFEQTLSLTIPKNVILEYLPTLEEWLGDTFVKEYRGLFYVYNIENFSKELLLDFVTNDPIGRKFLIMKEDNALIKRKKTNQRISMTCPLPNKKLITVTFSIMIMSLERGDQVFKTKYWSNIGLGNLYLLITTKINVDTEITPNDLKQITTNFAKLMTLYSESAPKTAKLYNDILKTSIKFTKKKEPKSSKNPALKYKVPELFVNGYPRACQKMQTKYLKEIHAHHTLDEALADTNHVPENQKLRYLAFPADEAFVEYVRERTGYEGDLDPIPIEHATNYYTCNNPEYTVAGLTENKLLSNREVFPYLPCCFKRTNPHKKSKKDDSQEFNPGTNLWKYLHGIRPDDNVSHAATDIVIKGFIQLKPNIKGPVAVQMEDTLKIIKPKYKFYRLGVEGSKNESFITCLSKSLGLTIDVANILATDEGKLHLAQLKQCNWEMTLEEISNMLQDGASYMDPRRVLPFFEHYFNVNIILFGDVEITPGNWETTIIQPRSKNGYLLWDHNRVNTIMVYMSTGSKHVQDERSELVIADNEHGELVNKFNRQTYEYLFYLTTKIYEQFSLFTPYHVFKFPAIFENVKYQMFDVYGKIMRIQIDNYTIDTQPLPPIAFVEVKELEVMPIDDEDALKELTKKGKYVVKETKIIIKKKGINFSVYYKHDAIIVNMNKYVNDNKCANVLKDIFVYQFSKYWNERGDSEIDGRTVREFVRRVEIVGEDDRDYYYEFLKDHSPKFQQDYTETLFYPNLECKRRLAYYLSLLVKYNPTYVKQYRNSIYLDHFYSNIYDFTHDSHYFITSSLESLQYINRQYKASNNIIKDNNEPYFIYSPWTTRGTPVLTLNMYTVDAALKMSVYWHKYRYIPDRYYDGTFEYVDEFEGEYLTKEEAKHTIIDLQDDKNLEKMMKRKKRPHKHIIAKTVIEGKEYACPLLY